MTLFIRELRESTGLTQKAFAELFDIPVSTLRKWEQGEASPPPYVLKLIARSLPEANQVYEKIPGKGSTVYYYNKIGKTVADMLGNIISIKEDLEDVKKQNLVLYLEDLFEGLYQIQEKFNRDCSFDKQEDILWSRQE